MKDFLWTARPYECAEDVVGEAYLNCVGTVPACREGLRQANETCAMGRRRFLEGAGAAALLAAGGCACPGVGRPLCEYDDELIDRCWLWGHETGQVDGPGNGWKLDAAKTYYHMADAARFMGLHNLNAIRWDKPSRAFRDSLRGLKRVTWPMSGNKTEINFTYDALADWNFAVADEMPNVAGATMLAERMKLGETPVSRIDELW